MVFAFDRLLTFISESTFLRVLSRSGCSKIPNQNYLSMSRQSGFKSIWITLLENPCMYVCMSVLFSSVFLFESNFFPIKTFFLTSVGYLASNSDSLSSFKAVFERQTKCFLSFFVILKKRIEPI